MNTGQKKELTIRGTILPAEWDADGNITSIGIGTSNEEDYLIFLNKMGEELVPFIDRKVEVEGTVKNVYGDFIFTINKYRILDENDEGG
jgi:hypothetical protein